MGETSGLRLTGVKDDAHARTTQGSTIPDMTDVGCEIKLRVYC